MDETELQDRLTRLAERTAPPPCPGLADVVVARHRTRRRSALATTGLVAAVCALVVAATTLIPDRPSAQPADAASSAAVLAGATRGSLAGDRDFVEGVRRLPWTSPDFSGSVPQPPVGTRQVVFAGDVPGGRWALVTGQDTAVGEVEDDVAMAWFWGPPGATAAEMVLDSVPYGVDPQLPVARADTVSGALVVVAAPGDVVEVSTRPDIAADGSASRAWQPVDAPDGVAVTALPSTYTPSPTAVRYRVLRGGIEVARSVPDGRAAQAMVTSSSPVTWLRTGPVPSDGSSGDDFGVQSAVSDVLGQTGLTLEDPFSVTALWAGEVPGPRDRPARVTVLAVTLPSGAVYLTVPYGWSDADGSGVVGSCGSALRAGGAVEQVALAVRCDVSDGAAEASSALVVLAPGATAARAVDLAGAGLAEFPVDGDVAVTPAPEQVAAVVATTADGDERLPLLSSADLGD